MTKPMSAYQTLPIVMVAFFKDNSVSVPDLLLCFPRYSVRPSFGYDRQIVVDNILILSRGKRRNYM